MKLEMPKFQELDDAALASLDKFLTHASIATDAMIRARKFRKEGDNDAADSWFRFADIRVAQLDELLARI